MGDLYSQIPPLNLGALVKSCVSKGEREEKDWGSKTDSEYKQSWTGILVPELNSHATQQVT